MKIQTRQNITDLPEETTPHTLKPGTGHSFRITGVRFLRYLIFLLLAMWYFSLYQNALIDDAFISLDYVKNLIRAVEWGLIPGTVTNTATSPLNVMVMAVFSLVTGVSTSAPVWVASICSVVSVFFLEKISTHLFQTRYFGMIAAIALMVNPLLVSTLGMESILFGTLLIICLYVFLAKRWNLLAFFLGLLTLARPDGLIFVVVFFMLCPSFRSKGRFTGIYLLTVLPWILYSWIHLGSFIPDTFFIKVLQNTWGEWGFSNGLSLYYKIFTRELIFSIAFVPFLLTLINRRVRRQNLIVILIVAELVRFSGYALMNVPPYHWYYAPLIYTIILVACLGVGVLYSTEPHGTRCSQSIKFAPLLFLAVVVVGQLHWLYGEQFTVREMPIHTNRVTMEQYQTIGLWLKGRCTGQTINLEGEIGTLAYYSDCTLLDWFSDRRWLINLVEKQQQGNGLFSSLVRFNFTFIDANVEYPEFTHQLNVYIDRKVISAKCDQVWKTRTKWTPDSLVDYCVKN